MVGKKVKLEISPKRFSKKNRKGQVWIETVIYTLIAMIMIGAVLSWGRPKIEELQDKSIIEQTIGIFEDIDSQILSVVQGGTGNKRVIEIGLKKGTIFVHKANDTISYEVETKYTYSEPGQDIYIGNIKIHTLKKGEYNEVALTLNYGDVYDLRFDGNNDGKKAITKSSTPYQLLISNVGENDEGKIIIDLTLN